MPYKRYPRRKKENPYKKRVRIYGGAGKQVYKDVMYLKSIVNAEPKYHRQAITADIDDNGQVNSLSNIPQGDGPRDRDGTSVLPRFLSVQATLKKNMDASASDFNTIKLLVFRYWGEGTDAAPNVTIGDVLQSSDCLSFLNDDNTGKRGDRERRIEVHKSMLITLDKVFKTSSTFKLNIQVNGPSKQIKDHIKFRSSTTEDPLSGGFYLLFISDESNLSSFKPSIDWRCKLTYYDN